MISANEMFSVRYDTIFFGADEKIEDDDLPVFEKGRTHRRVRRRKPWLQGAGTAASVQKKLLEASKELCITFHGGSTSFSGLPADLIDFTYGLTGSESLYRESTPRLPG